MNNNPIPNESRLTMEVTAKRLNNGQTHTNSAVMTRGNVGELLSGLCVGVRSVLKNLGISDEMFIRVYMNQIYYQRTNIQMNVGDINQILKEDEDND